MLSLSYLQITLERRLFFSLHGKFLSLISNVYVLVSFHKRLSPFTHQPPNNDPGRFSLDLEVHILLGLLNPILIF